MNKYKARLFALWYLAKFIKNHGIAAAGEFSRKDVEEHGVGALYIRSKIQHWEKARVVHNAAVLKRIKEASVKKS